jgi:hypothetical protein
LGASIDHIGENETGGEICTMILVKAGSVLPHQHWH